MSRGGKYSNIDRVIELFRENTLYKHLKAPVALFIELILQTGATPIDIVNIQSTHINREKKELILHINKKKHIATTTHTISSKAIETFFSLERTKPISSYSIRRIQQLIKEETEKIGSTLTNPRSLRKEYLKQIFFENPQNIQEQTQIKSLRPRTTLTKKDQQKLFSTTYSKRNKLLILSLLQTGVRINELLQLQAKHTRKKSIQISSDISHNKTTRTVSIDSKLLDQFSTEGYLFTSNRNNPISQRRFEQICKEVGDELSIKELTPSILRATAIKNLSTQLSEEELLLQTGLGTSTIYTHSIFTQPKDATNTTTILVDTTTVERKDNESNDADRYMYTKSKLKDGGDANDK